MAMTPGTSATHAHVATHAAVTPPTSSWPSAPMLNNPARNATARASAEPMNGTARATEAATLSGLPTMPRTRAQYASNGLTPIRAMSTPPTMNDNKMA